MSLGDLIQILKEWWAYSTGIYDPLWKEVERRTFTELKEITVRTKIHDDRAREFKLTNHALKSWVQEAISRELQWVSIIEAAPIMLEVTLLVWPETGTIYKDTAKYLKELGESDGRNVYGADVWLTLFAKKGSLYDYVRGELSKRKTKYAEQKIGWPCMNGDILVLWADKTTPVGYDQPRIFPPSLLEGKVTDVPHHHDVIRREIERLVHFIWQRREYYYGRLR